MKTCTRRLFLGTSLGGVGIAAFNPLDSRAEQGATCSNGPQGWSESRLSKAVLDGAIPDLSQALDRTRDGSLRSDDLRVAASSARLLFAHYDEIGLTVALQRQLEECKNNPSAQFVTLDQERTFRDMLTRRAIRLSEAEVHKMFSMPPDRKDRALEKALQIGLQQIHAAAVSALDRRAASMRPISGTRWEKRGSLFRVAFTDSDCEEFQLIIDTIGIVAGLNGIGCLVGCVACCGIAAGAVLIMELLQYVHDLLCEPEMARRRYGDPAAILAAC